MSPRVSRKGGGAPGHDPTGQASEATPRQGLTAGNGLSRGAAARSPNGGISDEQFNRLLSQWADDPNRQDISVSISLKCSGLTLRVREPPAVIAMLKAEQARRKEAREAEPR